MRSQLKPKQVPLHDGHLATIDQGQGPVVLLAHGFPMDHVLWVDLVEPLAQRWRVLAPDLRGFGQSRLRSAPATMERMADDLAGLLDALEVTEPIVFCGLSMGGYIAAAFWRKYASRIGGLVLMDTKSAADSPEVAAGRETTAQQVLREGLEPVADAMIPKLLAETTRATAPEVVERLRKMILRCPREGVAAAARGMAQRRDFTPELGQMACPTLVVAGQHDPLSPPAQMRELAACMPSARLVVIPGAAHVPPLEQPVETVRVLSEFLETLP